MARASKQPKCYTKTEVTKLLKKHVPTWSTTPKATAIKNDFDFPDFIEAFMFVARITVHAEILKHHPDLSLSYGKVSVKLATHDVKGLTKLDFDLARKVDEVYARMVARRTSR